MLLAIAFRKFLVVLLILGTGAGARAGEEVRVMSFNLWHGGEAGGQPLRQTAQVIRQAKADVVGIQESHGIEKAGVRIDNGRKLAEMLGWSYFDQGDRTGILTRFEIVSPTPRRWGAQLRLPSGRVIWMFNAHLAHAPYQPYQLLGIPYANAGFIKTSEEAVGEARRARGGQVERLLDELRPVLATGDVVFLTGDFNEPSHLDWTPRAAEAGRCPLAVDYPSTRAVVDAGMRDAYRTAYPDEVRHRGDTWTPTTSPSDRSDRHDRIDFVFFGGKGAALTRCRVVGESKERAHVVVKPYPSDHRSVVATFKIR